MTTLSQPLDDILPLKNNVAIKIRGFNTNVDQKFITVTEDKVHLCLDRNLKKMGKRRWVHPLSLFCSFALSLATSEFDKLTWVSPELLRAIFIVSAAVTCGWLIWDLMKSAQLRHTHEVIEDIFEDIKGNLV